MRRRHGGAEARVNFSSDEQRDAQKPQVLSRLHVVPAKPSQGSLTSRNVTANDRRAPAIPRPEPIRAVHQRPSEDRRQAGERDAEKLDAENHEDASAVREQARPPPTRRPPPKTANQYASDERLRDGVHQLEDHGDGPRRWTNGELALVLHLWDGLSGQVVLRVTYDATTIREWSAPAGVSQKTPSYRPKLRAVR